VDPFAAVWDELVVVLTTRPERTAKELLVDLQARYPGQYADKSLRTLQRRVRAWRASAILTFDVEWVAVDPLAGMVMPLSAPSLAAAQQSG
jgi:hypothetical protein